MIKSLLNGPATSQYCYIGDQISAVQDLAPQVKHRGRYLKELLFPPGDGGQSKGQCLERERMTPGGDQEPNSQDPAQTYRKCPGAAALTLVMPSRYMAGSNDSRGDLVSS